MRRFIKIKQSHNTPMEAQGERRYSSYSFTTSALDGGQWLASRPGRALVPGKGPPVPLRHEAGWIPEPVWTQRLEEKSSWLCRGSNLDRPIVQPVSRHYTDRGIRLMRLFTIKRIHSVSRGKVRGFNPQNQVFLSGLEVAITGAVIIQRYERFFYY
jgi:hypothetical protein